MSDHSADAFIEASQVADILSITRTLIRVATSTDAKDWALLHQQFADELLVDFGAVKPAERTKADDLVAWSTQGYSQMITQHIVTNHDVQLLTATTARATSYGRAIHRQAVSAGESYWNLYCRYDHELLKTATGWKITRLKMTPLYQEGNVDLVTQAYQDAARA